MVSPDYSKYPESDCITNYIYQRHKKGLYSLILVTGLPGTGKSSVCQRLAEILEKEIPQSTPFNENKIVDSLLDLLEFVRNVKEPGQIAVIEEVSVLFPSRRAMSKENVAVGRVLDTCRKKGVILISNAPLFTSIDSHFRAMSHVLVETLRINKAQQIVTSKAWRLQTNPFYGKTFRHRFKRNGREVHFHITKMPNLEIWNRYEEKKDKFLGKLYNKLTEEQEKKEGKKVKERVIRKLSKRELEVQTLLNQGMNNSQIAGKLGVDPSRITRIKQNINKKMNIVKENEENDLKK